MDVIINIPQRVYKDIKESYSIQLSEATINKIIKSIKNGVPLSEHTAQVQPTEE